MTKEMQNLALAPVGNLESYIRAANAWPMLSADEERALAEKLHYQGDLEAAKTLILSHLRFVVHVARNYAGYGLPQADLIQEGNIGLMKAVRRFNPEVGVRLVSFAVHWIKAEILNTFCVTGVSLKSRPLKRSVNCSLTCVKPSSVWAGLTRTKLKWLLVSWVFPAKTCAKWNPVWRRKT